MFFVLQKLKARVLRSLHNIFLTIITNDLVDNEHNQQWSHKQVKQQFKFTFGVSSQNIGKQTLMNKQKSYSTQPSKKLQGSSDNKEIQSFTTQNYQQNRTSKFAKLNTVDKIKSNPSFSLDKISTRTFEISKSGLLPPGKIKQVVKLPPIRAANNPEILEEDPSRTKQKTRTSDQTKIHYQSNLHRCLKKHQTSYLMNLYRQHFYQCIEVLRFGKSIKIPHPKKQFKLSKKNPSFKTIFLDMDETLIHTDEASNSYTVKLNFPLQKGGVLAAGVRIRPFCVQFLQKLSQFAEIIIFTASSASYADVILNHIDPQKKWISHRLYRQHCTLEKGYYLKDLRVVNRDLKDVVLVDNSPYCHILQPENAIPIVPFYHFTKDRQLQILLEYLKAVITAQDLRTAVSETFFWQKYMKQPGDPRKIFFKYFQKDKGFNQEKKSS